MDLHSSIQPLEGLTYGEPLTNSDLDRPDARRRAQSRSDAPKTERLIWVEGLRGLACYGVFNGHFSRSALRWADNLNPDSPMFGFLAPYLKPIILGEFAVAMFFILSGRVLASGFLKRPSIETAASAILRRPFRLLIPVFGTEMLYLMIRNWGWYETINNMSEEDWPTWMAARGDSVAFDQHPTLLTGILQSLSTGMTGGIPCQFPMVVTWTIQIEMAGSFLVYAVALLVYPYGERRWWIYITMIIYLLWCQTWWGLFLIGLLFSDLGHSGITGAFKASKAGRITMCLCALLTVLFLPRWYYWDSIWAFVNTYTFNWRQGTIGLDGFDEHFFAPAPSIVAFFLVCFVELSTTAQKILSMGPIKYLGRVSFGMYLMHPLVYYTVGPWATVIFMPIGYPMDSWRAFFFVYTPVLMVTLVCSEIFTRTLDPWGVQFGHYINGILKGQRPVNPDWIKDLPRRTRDISFALQNRKMRMMNYYQRLIDLKQTRTF